MRRGEQLRKKGRILASRLKKEGTGTELGQKKGERTFPRETHKKENEEEVIENTKDEQKRRKAAGKICPRAQRDGKEEEEKGGAKP